MRGALFRMARTACGIKSYKKLLTNRPGWNNYVRIFEIKRK